jgi:hypothetical protein
MLMAAAFLDASSAMAGNTQLCMSDENPCATGNVISHVHEETVSGSPAKLLSSLGNVTCNALFLGLTLGLGAPFVIHGNFTYTGCLRNGSSCTVNEVSTSTLINVLRTEAEKATVTGEGEVNVHCGLFINCTYDDEGVEGTFKGALSAPTNGESSTSEATMHHVGGGICPETEKLDIRMTPLLATYLGDGGGGGGLSSTSTSLTTSLKGGGKEGAEITVAEGSKVKDTATLSGENSSKAGGTLDYAVYKDKECKELVAEAGKVTVKEGKVPDSEEKELEAGREYFWQAKYLGDEMNKESTSTCNKEVETVKAKTTLATSLSGGGKEGEEITVSEGSKVKDTASLSGTKASSATGTVDYAAYKDKECKELASKAGEGKVEGTKAAASEEKELEAAAVYYWQARYLGDSLHEESTSPCTEKETVKANTTLATSLSGGGKEGEEITVSEGSKVKDTASLSGTKASTATGTVQYFIYEDEECMEPNSEAGLVSVEAGKVPVSTGVALPAGIYYWRAVYYGDFLHEMSAGACGAEVETVEESPLLLTTMLSGEEQLGKEIEVADESSVTDTATLAGEEASTAMGTVEYDVYSDEACEELEAEAGTVTVEKGKVPVSKKMELPMGTYYWQAVYSGDLTHEEVAGVCGDEIEIVAENTSLKTSLSRFTESGKEVESGEKITAQEGDLVHDTATLSGKSASKAVGIVEYNVYLDENCEELRSEAGTVSVEEEGVVPPSNDLILPAGTYYWQAVYYGDLSNKSSISPCGTEVEEVSPASLTTSLSGEGQAGEEVQVQEISPVADTATLEIAEASTATGTVEYDVYSDEACEELEAEAGTVTVEKGKIPGSTEVELPAGIYYWQAVYSGDLTHDEITSVCGDEIEVVAEETTLTTSLSGGGKTGEKIEVDGGVAVADTATLSGANASGATGYVKYFVYADEKCEELEAEAGEVAVEGESVPASPKVGKLKAGTYYWKAVYYGDSLNKGSVSACGSEIEKVKLASLTTSLSGEGKTGEEIEVEAGVAVTDTATLTTKNASTATGTVEYNVYSDEECKKLQTEAGKVEIESNGKIPSSTKVELSTGTYYWQAVYFGDAEHEKAVSLCGMEVQKVPISRSGL